MSNTYTTAALKALGLRCKQTENAFGFHFAIFRGDKRISLGADTPRTARGAWSSLISCIHNGVVAI